MGEEFLRVLRQRFERGEITPLLTSETAPALAENYPYGFRLKTTARYWIEATKNGERVVFQTRNPKVAGEVWNKPKRSTYSDLRVLYRENASGRIENAALSFAFNDDEDLNNFLAVFGLILTPSEKERVLYFRAVIETRKFVSVSVSGDLTEKEREESEEKEKRVRAKIGLIFASNYEKIKRYRESEKNDGN